MDTATGPSTMLPSYPILGWYLQSCHDHQLIIYQAIHLSFILWNSWCLICSWFSLPLLIVEVGVTIRDLGTLIYQFWFHSCFVFPWLFIFPHGHFLAGPGGRPSSFGWKTKEEVNLRLQADHLCSQVQSSAGVVADNETNILYSCRFWHVWLYPFIPYICCACGIWQ